MNVEEYYSYCLGLPGVTEDFPFDESTLVFRVGGKIFALLNVDAFTSVNLKCDPEKAVHLREQYDGIIPGYHMNKKHWNTVSLKGDISDDMIRQLTHDSYTLIKSKLSAKERQKIQ